MATVAGGRMGGWLVVVVVVVVVWGGGYATMPMRPGLIYDKLSLVCEQGGVCRTATRGVCMGWCDGIAHARCAFFAPRMCVSALHVCGGCAPFGCV